MEVVLSLELVRMGIGAGMRTAMLLEVDLRLEGQLEGQLGQELVRMGIGTWMRAGVLLEVDLRLEGQPEEQLELNPRKPREIPPDLPKSRLLVQNGLPRYKWASNDPLGGLLEPLSKPEKVHFAPGTFYKMPAPRSTIYMKSAFSRNLRGLIHVATPPFSSISFLLTAHAGNTTPATIVGLRRLRLWLAVLGGWSAVGA